VIALLIFGATFVLIAGREIPFLPIGRPGATLCGAAAMVAFGVMTPAQALGAVDLDTIALLFGMMLLTAFLSEEGTLPWLEGALLARAGTPWRYLVLLSWLAALSSAWLVNDTVAVFLGASVVRACVRTRMPLLPYLLALATSANLGSAATLVGNPQNMLIASMSHLGFADYLMRVGPAVLVAMVLQTGLLWLYFGRSLPDVLPPSPVPPPRVGIATIATLGAAVAFLAGAHLGFAALTAAAVVTLGRRRDLRPALAQVDFGLLVFFAGLFVVVHGLDHAGWTTWAQVPSPSAAAPLSVVRFAITVVLGSNVVSNVPLVMLLGPHLGSERLPWLLLGFVSTVAGNLTLVGSVANLIVAEAAKDHHEIGFWEYARFGVVSTAVSLLAGIPLILLFR
jgi:Na+/H+ antiporter NhaD/arsenite permease-like protein